MSSTGLAAAEAVAAAQPRPGQNGRRGGLRHQLPVCSPVSARALSRTALGIGTADARERLGELLRAEYAASDVVLTGSGTQALQLAIEVAWRRVGRSGSVALPGFACFDLASAAVGAGAPVSFFDVEPGTLGPDLDSLESALRRGASVVVVAPLYGIPVEWDVLEELVARYGAVLIEDAAQGQGALWRNRPLGSLGVLSVLSFGRGKGWTGGGGGALLMRGALAGEATGLRVVRHERRRETKTLAALALQWAIGRPGIYGIPAALPFLRLGETVYHEPASPETIDRAAASLALQHRTAAMDAVAARRKLAEVWQQRLRESAGTRSIGVSPGGMPGYLRFPLLAEGAAGGLRADRVARACGIAPGYPVPLPELPALRGRIAGRARVPGAAHLAQALLTLPTHARVTDHDLDRASDLFRRASTTSGTHEA